MEARYTNGLNPVPETAIVSLLGDTLRICNISGSPLATWNLAKIKMPWPLPNEKSGEPLVLRLQGTASTERLTVLEPTQIKLICDVLRNQSQKNRTSSKNRWLKALIGIWVVVGLLWLGLPHFANLIGPLIPIHLEMAMGENMRLEVAKMLSSSRDPWVKLDKKSDRIITSMLARLENTKVDGIRRSRANQEPIRVSIIKSSVINAFALPGTEVVVTTGLLDELQSLDELAGILAHERAHVRQRHISQQLARSMVFRYLFSLFSGGSTPFGSIMAETIISSSWSRELEQEADAIALETLRQAQISPLGLADFFRRLETKEQNYLPEKLSTHPDTAARTSFFENAANYPTIPLDGADYWRKTNLDPRYR